MTDQELAAMLLEARKSGTPIQSTPQVADEAQAYRAQRLVMQQLGDIGGWKVGAPGPTGPISCAPMQAAFIVRAPHDFPAATFTQRDAESEIGFTLAHDLPPRNAPYARGEVIEAIATCQPGIEILQSRYADPERAGPLALLADFIQTGAYALGEPIEGWQAIDFATIGLVQTIEGGPTKQATGNPAGDMIRLIQWLADVGALWAGGLRAGQTVTCGSWTGKTAVPANGSVTTKFDRAQPLSVRFADPG